MITFQLLALAAIGLLIAVEVASRWKRQASGIAWLLRLGLWLAAGIGIASPELVTLLARQAGIQRGADLVLYVFVLAFLASSFYLYGRYVRLERQVVDLIRLHALDHPQRGGGE